jgi:hypothetical protein
MLSLQLARHGIHQMELRRKWWLQEPYGVHVDVTEAVRHEWVGPTMREIAAHAARLGFGLAWN